MENQRAQDPAPRTYFRADRFSLVNGLFYFSTREKTLEGPYPTREEAERESAAYVARLNGPQRTH